MAKFLAKLAYSSLLFCTLKVNPAYSCCGKEPKSLEILDEILLALQPPHSLPPHVFYKTLSNTLQCKTSQNKCHSFSNHLLKKLWQLLRDLERERKCIFDEDEWSIVEDSIMAAQGHRLTKQDQPDVFIIPDFLTPKKCKRLVKLHKDLNVDSHRRYKLQELVQLLKSNTYFSSELASFVHDSCSFLVSFPF